MKPLTYRELRNCLNELSERQLDCSVCVGLGNGEFVDVFDTILSDYINDEAIDVVGENQPILSTLTRD
jgi:hypothetical protein